MTVRQTFAAGWSLRRVWWYTATARTRARYARTVLGGFWLGLSNLLSIGVLAIVYGTVFKVRDFNHYVVYIGLGLVVWNSMAAAISAAPNLFEHNAHHVHNNNVNPIFYTLEEWAFQVQTFGQSFALVLLALTAFKPALIPNLLLVAWLPLANLLLFLYWFPLLLCLLGARYRDLYQLVPIVLQLAFLLSPILYEQKNLGSLAWTAELNPLFQVLNPLRQCLINAQAPGWRDVVLLMANLIGWYLSLRLLNRERRALPFLI